MRYRHHRISNGKSARVYECALLPVYGLPECHLMKTGLLAQWTGWRFITRYGLVEGQAERVFRQSAKPVLGSITAPTASYSVRRAIMGSTVAARRAGNSADNIATTATITVPRINATGSAGLTL